MVKFRNLKIKWRFLVAGIPTWLLIIWVCSATEISNRFAVIGTFKDDRYINAINENFRRLTKIFVADGGFNLVVKGTTTVVQLNTAQTDTDYGIHFTTSWPSTFTAVMNKTTENFKAVFSTPGVVAGGTIDWALTR